jgi:ketosteroid isomerase-like protein
MIVRKLVLSALLVATLGTAACGGDVESSGESSATETTAAPTGSAAPLTADQAGSDEEQIRAVLKQEHDAFLAGDTVAYCELLADDLRAVMAGCEFIRNGLAFQQSSGAVMESQEILELTVEGDRAYAAVYDQLDNASPGAQTPSDLELTKTESGWRISKARYRTEREVGPAKCFVGGSTADLC